MTGVALDASLPAGDAAKKLGTRHFYFQRVRAADSGRDDSLRHDQDGAGSRGARHCRNNGGYRRNREFSSGRAYQLPKAWVSFWRRSPNKKV